MEKIIDTSVSKGLILLQKKHEDDNGEYYAGGLITKNSCYEIPAARHSLNEPLLIIRRFLKKFPLF
ncbi:MAG: hypothetical protein ABI358_12190 [Ginsengibacter sp.]